MKCLPAVCFATVMCLATAIPAAWADTVTSGAAAPSGTGFASAANVLPGSGLNPVLSTSGDLGDLLDFLAPVVDQYTQPLADAIATLPSTMVADVADDIGQTSTATATSAPIAAPNGYPGCDDAAWSAGNCYHQSGVAANDNPIIAMRISGADGWAATDSTGASAAARSTGVSLTALGIPVMDIGTVTSTTSCTSDGTCSNTASFDDVNVLGGAALVRSADDGSPQVSFDSGNTWTGLADLQSTSISGDGDTATVQASGSALEVSVSLTLQQLADAVGQSTDVSSFGAYDDGSVVALDLFIGGVDTGSSNERGPGLRLGIGISADIKTSVFGLVDSELQIADDHAGNAADIAVAFTAASNVPAGNQIGDPASLK